MDVGRMEVIPEQSDGTAIEQAVFEEVVRRRVEKESDRSADSITR